MLRTARFALPLLFAGLVSSAAAQDADPYELIRQLDAKLTEAAAISYSAVRAGHGSLATTPPAEGQVTASLQNSRLMLRVEGRSVLPDGSTPEFVSAYDGSTATSIRHADKQFVSGRLDESFAILTGSGEGLTRWLLLWNDHIGGAFRDGREAYSLEYDGLAVIDGDAYHSVRLGLDEYGAYESWVFLDTETLLPRRFEFGQYDNSADMGIVSIDLRDMTLLESVNESIFIVTAPDGYESVDGNAGQAGREDDRSPRRSGGVAVGSDAPVWALDDPQGNEFALEDYRGKVVVMDFWATWCGPCVMAMPGLQRLHQEFSDDPVAVIGVNCWENGDPQAFMDSKGLNYQLLVGGDQVAQAYGVTGIPTFYVIGKDGKVVHHEVGFDPDGTDRLREVIKEALAD